MQLQIFQHKDLGNVRVIGNNENPLFCLADVCKILEIQDTYKVKEAILREFELSTLEVGSFDTGYGIKDFNMITEPQLYFVLMRSDKPKAKPFRQWVVNEVLPSIRKNGYYINQNKKTRAKQEQILHNLITELQDSNTQKDCIKQENESLKDEVIALQRKLLALYDNKDKKEVKILPEHYGKRLSEEEKIQILSLREEGKSMREIQEIMQRSEHALYCVLREAKRGVLEYR
ncbi:BRO family protein [Helicobacter trogontum]|uniref:Antirepressor, BRO family protein n=1 Tax=Helicobacter trogontum TaxID=50960 RepID=A0A099V916_9HELI|nr:BRO family protein [Helicobacter trogontum]TLD81291.1 antirepressor, BRO family protein [Helicobacter trogontum]